MEFKLLSVFLPTGDQPQAIEAFVNGFRAAGCHRPG